MVNGIKWNNETVVRQINLMIPLDSHFVYTCQNLHAVPHGDEKIQDKPNLDKVLKSVGVDVVDVVESTNIDPLRVYYSSSELMKGVARRVKDVDIMQKLIFDYLIDMYEMGKGGGNRDSNGVRVDFGLGQNQPSSMTYLDKRGRKHRMPFCNLDSFNSMNDSLKTGLSELLLYLHQELHGKNGPYDCNDDWRTELVANIFREAGWAGPFFGWEYINISLRSAEDALHKHFDSKNDQRLGYNHAPSIRFSVHTPTKHIE